MIFSRCESRKTPKTRFPVRFAIPDSVLFDGDMASRLKKNAAEKAALIKGKLILL